MAQSGSQEGPLLSGVALRYASALFEVAREANAVDAVAGDLDRFDGLIQGSDDLQRLIRSPVFTAEEQVEGGRRHSRQGRHFGPCGQLHPPRRRQAPPLRPARHDPRLPRPRGRRRRASCSAQVTLAEEPSDKVLNEIKAALRDVAKADVALDVKIDPSLIGGLIVKMGSRMVDASVRTKLNSIRLAMKEVR